MVFFFLASNQNKRVAIIELRNENEQNVISYDQLRKSKIALLKKFQTVYSLLKLYLKNKYMQVEAEFI